MLLLTTIRLLLLALAMGSVLFLRRPTLHPTWRPLSLPQGSHFLLVRTLGIYWGGMLGLTDQTGGGEAGTTESRGHPPVYSFTL
jgi:hypothetical protein